MSEGEFGGEFSYLEYKIRPLKVKVNTSVVLMAWTYMSNSCWCRLSVLWAKSAWQLLSWLLKIKEYLFVWLVVGWVLLLCFCFVFVILDDKLLISFCGNQVFPNLWTSFFLKQTVLLKLCLRSSLHAEALWSRSWEGLGLGACLPLLGPQTVLLSVTSVSNSCSPPTQQSNSITTAQILENQSQGSQRNSHAENLA